MKKANCFILLFVTFTTIAFAQKLKPKTDDCNFNIVRSYYESVYQAEQFIMNGNLDSAFSKYIQAMNYKYLQQRDYYPNVFKLLSKANSYLIFSYYLTQYKYTADTLTPQEFIGYNKDYLSDDIINQLSSTLYSVAKTPFLFQDEKHKKISNIIAPLFESDQALRAPSTGNNYLKIKRQIKADKKNFNTIINCYKKFGSYNIQRLSGDAKSTYENIILHRFSNKKVQEKYNLFFENEIKCGNIDPRKYAIMVDDYLYDSTQVYGFHTIFFVGDTLIVYQLSDDGQKRINENRMRIFLEDIETTHKKLIWQWQHYNEFVFYIIRELIPLDSLNAIEIANQHMKLMGSMVSGYHIYSR